MAKIVKQLTIPALIDAPRSKSYSNRAIIRACYLDKETRLNNISSSTDVSDLICIIKELGYEVEQEQNDLIIKGRKDISNITIEETDGGTTLRFAMALAASLDCKVTFRISSQLQQRPMNDLYEAFRMMGKTVETTESLVTIYGVRQKNKEIRIDCSMTTQFASALMLIGQPIEPQNVKSSKQYIEMTKSVIASLELSNKYTIPADFSSLSYIAAYSFLYNTEIIINGVEDIDWMQGDSILFELMEKDSYKFINKNLVLNVKFKDSIDLDCSNCLDLVPTLCLIASNLSGTSTFSNIQNLRFKESNRIDSITALLKEFSISVNCSEDTFEIKGSMIPETFRSVDIPYDHRIAMIACLLVARNGGGEVSNLKSIQKSYPDFLEFIKN